MYISSSEVTMASSNTYQSSCQVSTKRTINPVIVGNGFCLVRGEDGKESVKSNNSIKSNDFLSSYNYCLNKKGGASEVDNVGQRNNHSEASKKIRLSTLNYLLMLLLGEKINGGKGDLLSQALEDAFITTDTCMVTTESTYSYSESQSLSYSATGTVLTEDGRELSFNYSFSMSSSFSEICTESSSYVTKFELVDPLVIKLDSNPMEIPDQKFYFDLDSDGEEEEISTTMRGAGYLALDLNGDGIINNGKELFGPSTGNGFKELAKYDDDGNGWIDENDSIFSKLRIWTMDEDGNPELYGLKESDVGAIYLGRMKTDYKSYNDKHELQGVIRQTGIFLRESDGQAGAVMHVDLAT